MNPQALWALPSPFDGPLVVVATAVQVLWLAAVRATRNLRTLGPWWPVGYWLAVVWSWRFGHRSSLRLRLVRRGNDAFEFDPARRGGRWIGLIPVRLIRLQIIAAAWRGAGGMLVGYGLCFALIVIGVVWLWLLTIAAALLFGLAARGRWMSRVPWWERT